MPREAREEVCFNRLAKYGVHVPRENVFWFRQPDRATLALDPFDAMRLVARVPAINAKCRAPLTGDAMSEVRLIFDYLEHRLGEDCAALLRLAELAFFVQVLGSVAMPKQETARLATDTF